MPSIFPSEFVKLLTTDERAAVPAPAFYEPHWRAIVERCGVLKDAAIAFETGLPIPEGTFAQMLQQIEEAIAAYKVMSHPNMKTTPEDYGPEHAMNSYHLAFLVGKRHREVKADILDALGVDAARYRRKINWVLGCECDGDGDGDGPACICDVSEKQRTCYLLPRAELDKLIDRYDEPTQASIIRHWYSAVHDLRNTAILKGKPLLIPVPQTYAGAYQLCVELIQKNEALEMKWAELVADLECAKDPENSWLYPGYSIDESIRLRVSEVMESIKEKGRP
jgi:hypothetical protein